jgi:hypothetical protein
MADRPAAAHTDAGRLLHGQVLITLCVARDPIAQPVEQRTFNPQVVGSIPTRVILPFHLLHVT